MGDTELDQYRNFINQLYIHSLMPDSTGIRELLKNANRLAIAQGMADGSAESFELIETRLKNLSLIS